MLQAFVEGFDIVNITNNAFYVILVMIGFDVITGLLVAGRKRKINSSINFEGLIRKFGLIIALFFVTFVDAYFQTEGKITGLAVGMIILYEGISIIENFARIGIDLKFLTKWFDPKKVDVRKDDGK